MSKEMLELADAFEEKGSDILFDLSAEKINLIVAALRASAVAEPVAWECEDLAFGAGAFYVTNDPALAAMRKKYPDDWRVRPLYTHPAPAAPVREADQKVLADLDALIRSEQTGSRSTMQIAMAAEREIRRLASLPAPEAAPTREEIADPSIVQEVVAAFEHLRKKMRGDTKGEELAAFARVDRAILALKAAPAK